MNHLWRHANAVFVLSEKKYINIFIYLGNILSKDNSFILEFFISSRHIFTQ